MIETITAAARREGIPNIPILMHGYDYAFPDGRKAVDIAFGLVGIGPWMDEAFTRKGYPYKDGNAAQLEVRRALVRQVIDALYEMLAGLPARYPNVAVVDVRGVLPRLEDWHDELHPSKDGFKRVAGRFHAVLQRVLGGGGGGGGGRSLSLVTPGGGGEAAALPQEPPPPVDPPVPAPAAREEELLAERPDLLLVHAASAQARLFIRGMIDAGEPLAALGALEAIERERVSDSNGLPELPPAAAASEAALWQELEAEISAGLRWDPADDTPLDLLRSGRAAPRAVPTLAEKRAVYDSLFASCVPSASKAGDIAWYRQRIVAGRPRYQAIGAELTIPWHFIALIHALECSSKFTEHLHNGDPLTARTVRVPAGRPVTGSPPFSWETSARDALMMKGYHQQTDWSLAAMLYRFEKFNGWGYHYRGMATPYLWSFSNHYTRGKFVRDGVFDPAAVSRQAGAAVLLKDLVNRQIVQL